MNLNCSWNKENYQEFIDYLYTIQDLKYKEFHSKNTGTNELIGIKTPILKKIAKEISKGDYKSFIENNRSNLYELTMIEGFIYGYINIPFDELIDYINNYLKKVNNWSHVDLFVSNLKIFKKNQEKGFKFAKKLTHSKNNWIKRTGIVLLLNYFLHDIYVDKTLEIVSKIKTNDYYVKMALAWLMSIAYIKYKEKTLIYLVNIEDNFIYNKSLSKIIDSRRISNCEKDFIKSLRRKENKKEKIGV